MRILMISGKSASGKDTIAEYMKNILEDQGERVLVIHFADLVKAYLRAYYNWDGSKDEVGRAALIDLGTTKMRTKFPTYWAETVSKFISATDMDWDYVLIPDTRFYNEYETITQYNDYVRIIRINRYNPDGSMFLNPQMTTKQLQHQSETELDHFAFDWIIENDGDLEQLYDSVEEIMEEIMNA